MMYAWSFAARTSEEVARLVRALCKHRYLREADLRLHFTIDLALADRPLFGARAASFEALKKEDPELDLGSRDPRLWRTASIDEVNAALIAFWSPEEEGKQARNRLRAELEAAKLPTGGHEPFASSAEEPPFPELVLLDWELLAVEELDTERHAGALGALEDSGDEIDPSSPVCQEATALGAPELLEGAPNGALEEGFVIWSEGPYHYADYVFRGASKAAKLVDPPEGYRDLDEED